MKLLINAINLKSAGGLTVALNFIDQINKIGNKNLQTTVLAPPNAGYEKYQSNFVKIEIVKPKHASAVWRIITDYTWLRKRINQINPDVVFSMGNIAVPTKYPQAVLFMFPYAIYLDDVHIWNLMSFKKRISYKFKNWIFENRLQYAKVVFPQTATSQSRLNKFYPAIKEMCIVPMAYSTLGMKKVDDGNMLLKKKEGCVYLLCLTKYYMHKNVEIFLPLANLIKDRKLNIRIVTTVGANQAKEAAAFIQNISDLNLQDIIINIGPVQVESVPALYACTDGLLLPTLLESFSATYADAMFYKKPIFTSDRDFAKDVCENCAFYFDPHNPNDILNNITKAFANQHLIAEKTEAGYMRIQSFPNWNEVASKYIKELEQITLK